MVLKYAVSVPSVPDSRHFPFSLFAVAFREGCAVVQRYPRLFSRQASRLTIPGRHSLQPATGSCSIQRGNQSPCSHRWATIVGQPLPNTIPTNSLGFIANARPLQEALFSASGYCRLGNGTVIGACRQRLRKAAVPHKPTPGSHSPGKSGSRPRDRRLGWEEQLAPGGCGIG